MRIELRDERRRRIGRVDVDMAKRPTRVTADNRRTNNNGQATIAREVFLNWDTAVDDAGQLRRCVACGCTDMFHEKAFPLVTGLVVILAFIGAVVGALGLADDPTVLLAMVGVLGLDVAILVWSKRRLVCYRCRTSYRDLPIAGYHRTWDRAVADRYPVTPNEAVGEAASSADSRKGVLTS